MFGIIDLRAPQPPKAGEAFFCQDWQCPAHWQCRHHFGRSYHYAAMSDPLEMQRKRVRFFTPDRFKYSPQCDRFERDETPRMVERVVRAAAAGW